MIGANNNLNNINIIGMFILIFAIYHTMFDVSQLFSFGYSGDALKGAAMKHVVHRYFSLILYSHFIACNSFSSSFIFKIFPLSTKTGKFSTYLIISFNSILCLLFK